MTVKPLGPGLAPPGLDLPGEDPGIFAVSDPAGRELPGLLCGHEIHGACHGETDMTHLAFECPRHSYANYVIHVMVHSVRLDKQVH